MAREVRRRSKRSLLVAAHGQLCWLHTSKPGRPARLAHRQIRYLLESVGPGETWCAKGNIDNDPARRGGCRSLRPGRVTQARRPVDLADDFGSSVTQWRPAGASFSFLLSFFSFFLSWAGSDPISDHHDDGVLPTAVRCGYLPGVPARRGGEQYRRCGAGRACGRGLRMVSAASAPPARHRPAEMTDAVPNPAENRAG